LRLTPADRTGERDLHLRERLRRPGRADAASLHHLEGAVRVGGPQVVTLAPSGSWDIIRSLKRLSATILIGVILLAGVVILKPFVTGAPVDFHLMAMSWASRLNLWEEPQGSPDEPPSSPAEPTGSGDSEAVQGEEGSDEGPLGTESPSDNVIGPVPENLASGPAGRLSFWLAALDIARDYPLTGTGPGTFARMHLAYQVGPRYYASEAHSHPLQVWSETGTPGLLAWIGLVMSAAVVMFRRSGAGSGTDSELLGAVRGGFVLLLVHSAIDLDMSVPAVQVLFWLTMGTGCVLAVPPAGARVARSQQRPGVSPTRPGVRTTVVCMLVVLALVATLPVASTALSRSGYQLIGSGQPETGLARLRTAEGLNPLDPAPHVYLGSFLAALVERSPEDEALGSVTLSEFGAALALDPMNPNLYSARAHLLGVVGDHEAAVADLHRAISLAPYLPAYRYELAVLYAGRGEYEKALRELEEILSWWDVFLQNIYARGDMSGLTDDIYLLAAEAGAKTPRTAGRPNWSTCWGGSPWVQARFLRTRA